MIVSISTTLRLTEAEHDAAREAAQQSANLFDPALNALQNLYNDLATDSTPDAQGTVKAIFNRLQEQASEEAYAAAFDTLRGFGYTADAIESGTTVQI